MNKFRTLDDVEVQGTRVLTRLDLNVPMEHGRIRDATRIDRVLPTLRELSNKGARVIILAHLGRLNGIPDKEFSLRPIAKALQQRLGKSVSFCEHCIGAAAQKAVAALQDGDILLLENTRFHADEENNAPDFIAQLAKLGDLYVNDAFSATHRAHASTEGLAHRLPAFAGRLMQLELEALDKALGNPKKPVIAIVGGAKVSTKLDLLQNLLDKVDALVIGGGMANTFLHAQGLGVGKSLCEKNLADKAREILTIAEHKKCAIILPVDALVAYHFASDAPHHDYGIDSIPVDGMMLDIGERSITRINAIVDEAHTVLWNGPMGAFELKGFERGTFALAKYIAERTESKKLVSVAGGGDTIAALNAAGVREKLTYVSTAGGAFLEWMEGKLLPGVEVLMSNK